jgi:hypothetical protein
MSTAKSSSPSHPELVETPPGVSYVSVASLRHIEGFSSKRVSWLVSKMQKEQLWTRPVCLAPVKDASGEVVHLVMDGQHRTEAALRLGLARVPALLFDYHDVEIWSLRPSHEVTVPLVIARSLANDPYPYKTVKHRFTGHIPELAVPLASLKKGALPCV